MFSRLLKLYFLVHDPKLSSSGYATHLKHFKERQYFSLWNVEIFLKHIRKVYPSSIRSSTVKISQSAQRDFFGRHSVSIYGHITVYFSIHLTIYVSVYLAKWFILLEHSLLINPSSNTLCFLVCCAINSVKVLRVKSFNRPLLLQYKLPLHICFTLSSNSISNYNFLFLWKTLQMR